MYGLPHQIALLCWSVWDFSFHIFFCRHIFSWCRLSVSGQRGSRYVIDICDAKHKKRLSALREHRRSFYDPRYILRYLVIDSLSKNKGLGHSAWMSRLIKVFVARICYEK